MKAFYEANIDYITAHAVSADKRRYVDSTEAPRHFLDADHYGPNPWTKIPENYDDAAIKYSADTVTKYGIVPWAIEFEYNGLVKAFKAHDTLAILNISANLGHYVADAHVPLHLTLNYNGQLTGQTGIHALWESRIPELFGDSFNYYAGRARYIDDPLKEAFKICRASFNEVDSVLRFEKMLNKTFPADKKYVTEKRSSRTVTDYSEAYAAAYRQMLHGMVERRMRASIRDAGNYWFSAWVDAGQPDLGKLIKTPLNAEQRQAIATEESLYKAGKSIALAKEYAGKSSQTNKKEQEY
jgi:hypothetical protein